MKKDVIYSLMDNFRKGNEDAFDEIFREMYPALIYYGFKITGDQAASEDVAAESLLKVWERRVDFGHFLSLKAFLYTTVRNASIDWAKKKATREKAAFGSALVQDFSEKTRLEQLVKADTYRELYAAIKALPNQCRNVIALSYLEAKTLKEVSAELNIAIGSVKSQKSRGLHMLKKRLKYLFSFFL